jgi:hypothetical protein
VVVVTPLQIGLIAAGVIAACYVVLFMAVRLKHKDDERPIEMADISHREALRQLLEKAREEQDWYAEHAQG